MKQRTVAAIVLTLLLPGAAERQGFGQAASPDDVTRAIVTVDATHPWVDSGLAVRKGERLSFRATGTIHWGAHADQVAGPEGHDAKAGKLGAGGLIGRVGYNGKPFPIGGTRAPIAMPKSGKLFLGINDFIFSDNAGSFVVTISRPGVPLPPSGRGM